MFQFSPTNPAVAKVLLLTLASILAVTLDQEDSEAPFLYLGPGYSYHYLLNSTEDIFIPGITQMECAKISLNRDLHFFSYNLVNHLCKMYSPDNIMTANNDVEDCNDMLYFRESNGWIKTYALSMGANSLAFSSLLKINNPEQWNVKECNGTFCPNFFRNPLLDIWDDLPIDEVKMVIYKNQTAVVTLVFDGRNTSLDNWFSLRTLKSSPWLNIHVKYMGFIGNRHNRFYYIGNYGKCSNDNGLLVIVEHKPEPRCTWETQTHYPTILYADQQSNVAWSENPGRGDAMAIFISLIQQ